VGLSLLESIRQFVVGGGTESGEGSSGTAGFDNVMASKEAKVLSNDGMIISEFDNGVTV